MRKATGAAAMAALVMTGSVPAGLIVSRATSHSFAQLLCSGALGGEWAGNGDVGSCAAATTPGVR